MNTVDISEYSYLHWFFIHILVANGKGIIATGILQTDIERLDVKRWIDFWSWDASELVKKVLATSTTSCQVLLVCAVSLVTMPVTLGTAEFSSSQAVIGFCFNWPLGLFYWDIASLTIPAAFQLRFQGCDFLLFPLEYCTASARPGREQEHDLRSNLHFSLSLPYMWFPQMGDILWHL